MSAAVVVVLEQTMQIPSHVANAVVDPKAYADGWAVDEAFAWLRREAPLARLHPVGFNPFWAVTRHADIKTVELQNDVFRNNDRPLSAVDAATERGMMADQLPIRTLMHMDSPSHMAYRRLTQSWFMPQNLRTLEARVRDVAREFVDRMAATGGRCDFARDVAFLYPLRIIMEVLGVPPCDEPLMLHLTQELFGSTDPELGRIQEDPAYISRSTIDDFVTYFNQMTEDRRVRPRADLATAIANSEIDGRPIGHLEAMGYYFIIATAGHDTTSNSTAGGLWALCENPEQFRKLKSDPALIQGFVDESIRWVSPVKHFMRTAAEDAEVAGQNIAKGDWLMLCYHSGNRDEAVFPDPFKFDIERAPNKHLAFGYGPHVCLGQHLGRMEMRIFWEELLPRLESIELDGEPRRTEAIFVCGPKTVPVRFQMA
jgi:cytochrome P450